PGCRGPVGHVPATPRQRKHHHRPSPHAPEARSL
ncbi:MAG: hypothetical protein AVDCRST_MAG03-1840, partial [uncultured Rubrobacteraceae bacterium]